MPEIIEEQETIRTVPSSEEERRDWRNGERNARHCTPDCDICGEHTARTAARGRVIAEDEPIVPLAVEADVPDAPITVTNATTGQQIPADTAICLLQVGGVRFFVEASNEPQTFRLGDLVNECVGEFEDYNEFLNMVRLRVDEREITLEALFKLEEGDMSPEFMEERGVAIRVVKVFTFDQIFAGVARVLWKIDVLPEEVRGEESWTWREEEACFDNLKFAGLASGVPDPSCHFGSWGLEFINLENTVAWQTGALREGEEYNVPVEFRIWPITVNTITSIDTSDWVPLRAEPIRRRASFRPYRVHNYSRDILDHMGIRAPFTQFRGKEEEVPGPNTPYFGVELEVRPHRKTRDEAVTKTYELLGDNHIILKDDSSIGENSSGEYGFEIVTVPGTLSFHREMWGEFFKVSRKYLRSWNTGTCGMHVHLSKSAFKEELQQDAYVWFFDNPMNLPFIQTVAGRNLEEWARVDHTKSIKYRNTAKHRACSINKRNTLEIRIFKGTVHPNGFFKALEFVASLHEFITSATLPTEEEDLKEVLVFTEYLKWLEMRKGSYPALSRWLTFRKFFTKKGDVSSKKTNALVKPVLERMAPLKKEDPDSKVAIAWRKNKIARNTSTNNRVPDAVRILCEINERASEDVSDEELLTWVVGDLGVKLVEHRHDSSIRLLRIPGCSTRYSQTWWDPENERAVFFFESEEGPALYSNTRSGPNHNGRLVRWYYNNPDPNKPRKRLDLYDLIDEEIEKDFDETNPTYEETNATCA